MLNENYDQVIVKAGSGEYANTIVGAQPTAGETVWADTNGDGVSNSGGRDCDNEISHIILCPTDPTEAPQAPVEEFPSVEAPLEEMPTFIVLPSEPTPNPEPEPTDPKTPESPVIVLPEEPQVNPEAPADQPETLPHTGASVTALAIGAALLAAGATLVGVSRRQR